VLSESYKYLESDVADRSPNLIINHKLDYIFCSELITPCINKFVTTHLVFESTRYDKIESFLNLFDKYKNCNGYILLTCTPFDEFNQIIMNDNKLKTYLRNINVVYCREIEYYDLFQNVYVKNVRLLPLSYFYLMSPYMRYVISI